MFEITIIQTITAIKDYPSDHPRGLKAGESMVIIEGVRDGKLVLHETRRLSFERYGKVLYRLSKITNGWHGWRGRPATYPWAIGTTLSAPNCLDIYGRIE
jgi:hypothetical protein